MNCQIHRFRDSVAVSLGQGQTIYLSPEQAAKIGDALAACARDVWRLPFAESEFVTREIED